MKRRVGAWSRGSITSHSHKVIFHMFNDFNREGRNILPTFYTTMTKLEKLLLAIADEIVKSDTTNSRYYQIHNVSIRVSDHFSTKNTSDLQIIVPVNKLASGLYTVTFGDTGKVLIWNAKQIKEFLPSLILMKEMTTKSIFKADVNKTKTAVQKIDQVKQQPEIVKASLCFTKYIDSKLNPKYLRAIDRNIVSKRKSLWTVQEILALNGLIRKEFGRGDSINEDFQIFLNYTELSYVDVINLYKIVVIDNNRVPTIELLHEAYNYIK